MKKNNFMSGSKYYNPKFISSDIRKKYESRASL